VTNMTDPYQALVSFQQALVLGQIQLQPGALDSDLYVARDAPDGQMRLTYVRLEGMAVTVLVSVVHAEPIEGSPCFQIGYAVAETYRNQGRAIEAVNTALAELQHGLARAGIAAFYVEAIIGAENNASNGVARRTLSASPEPVTDGPSGQAALQYIRKIES
jgi:hypothetical protein